MSHLRGCNRNIPIGLNVFSHQSCATGALLLPKESYPRKYRQIFTNLFFNAYLKRELVAEAERRDFRVLPCERLEHGAGFVRVDVQLVVVVVHEPEVKCVPQAQDPFQTEGSADTVDVGVGVAEELVVAPRAGDES